MNTIEKRMLEKKVNDNTTCLFFLDNGLIDLRGFVDGYANFNREAKTVTIGANNFKVKFSHITNDGCAVYTQR